MIKIVNVVSGAMLERGDLVIEGKKVVLRATEQEGLQSINWWSNMASVTSLLGGWHFPSSLQDQKRWFGDYKGMVEKSN
jgi:hypothetical protein